MSEEILTLTLKTHGKIGVVHCGVTREGFIAVGGKPKDIADGEAIMFERDKIKAERKGSEYTFSKVD